MRSCRLSIQDLIRVEEVFAKHSHPRFIKVFSYHLPYGQKQAYRKEIECLGLERLTHMIRICGFLMQTKVCLLLAGSRDLTADLDRNQPAEVESENTYF